MTCSIIWVPVETFSDFDSRDIFREKNNVESKQTSKIDTFDSEFREEEESENFFFGK